MEKSCIKCGNNIPSGRLKALPKTDTCIECSDVNRKCGFRVITGKTTYSELQLVDEKTFDKLTNLQNRRGMSVGAGVAMNKINSGQFTER